MLQVKQVLDEVLEKLPDEFNVQEMMARVEDRTPYTVVAFQECERMNILTSEIKRSLKELDLGLKVSSTARLAVLNNEMLLYFALYFCCHLPCMSLINSNVRENRYKSRRVHLKVDFDENTSAEF